MEKINSKSVLKLQNLWKNKTNKKESGFLKFYYSVTSKR